MEVVLIAASLLLVAAMLGSLGWLTARREPAPVELPDDTV
jgi:hypothetical protein